MYLFFIKIIYGLKTLIKEVLEIIGMIYITCLNIKFFSFRVMYSFVWNERKILLI